jgi:ribosomal protein L18
MVLYNSSCFKFLFSATDLSAAESIARLLARRSLQFGICRVMFDKKETPVENAEFQKRLEAQVSLPSG